MVLNDVAEFALVSFGNNQNFINVIHAKVTTVGGAGLSMQQVADGVSGILGPDYKVMLPNAYAYKGLKARVVFPVPTAVVISVNAAGNGSLGAGDILPTQVAGVITLRASTAPPKTRGRMYLPPVTEAENTSAGVPSAAFGVLASAFTTFMTTTHTITVGADSITLTPVLYHRKPPQATYTITSATLRTAWGTQRRRSGINRGDSPAI